MFTNLLPATKSDPKGRTAYEWVPADGDTGPLAGLLTIKQPRAYTAYLVEEYPADRGRGFHLRKVTDGTDPEAESYSVNCHPARPHLSTCECRGWLRWNTNCKHILSLLDLIQNDKL